MTSKHHYWPVFGYKCRQEGFFQTLPPFFFNWSCSPAAPQSAAALPLKLLFLSAARTGQLPTIRDSQHLPAQ